MSNKGTFKIELKIFAKIVLIVTIVPFLVILICSVWRAFFLIGFNYDILYKIDVFLEMLFSTICIFTFLIPILPICLVYQIIYIIILFKKKITKNIKKV